MSKSDKTSISQKAKPGAFQSPVPRPRTTEPVPTAVEPETAYALIPNDPLSENEGPQVVFVWVTSTSPFFHRLAKVIVREICSYLFQETTQVYAIISVFLYIYNLRTNCGHQLFFCEKDERFPESMSSARMGHSRVFCCGGQRNFHIESIGYRKTETSKVACVLGFDGTWQWVAPMLKARVGHGVIVFKRRAFVFGTSNFGDFGNTRNPMTCESFNFDSGKWSKLPNLRFPRSVCNVCKLRDRAYIYGTHPNIEIFCILTKTFAVADLSYPNNIFSGVIEQSNQLLLITSARLLCLRQEGENDVLEVTERSSMFSGRFSVYWKGKIYSEGGPILRWINANDYSETEILYSLCEYVY